MDLPRPLHRPPFVPRPPLVLEIDLGRGLLTSPPSDPLTALRSRNTPQLADIISGLRRAASDDAVAGAVVHIQGAGLTFAQAEELGSALRDLAETGKPVVAWTESFGELGPGTCPYYLACHASSVWMQPSGSVGLTGVAVEITTLRGLLDKVGAEPQIGQRREYKSAAETLMSREISAANRTMSTRMAASVMEQVEERVRSARHLDAGSLDAAVASAPLSADRAVELGLVDRLGYRHDVYDHLRRVMGRDGEIRLRYAHRYAKHEASRTREQVRRRRYPVVGIVEVNGSIVVGRSHRGSPFAGPAAGSDSVCAALRAIAEDDDIKAVVLRVDSPGGSYVASDAIRAQVQRIQRSGRPVIASMGSVAASGGYFVAMPCDQIVALPSTLTGSIGVLGGKLVLEGTADKVGVTREAAVSGSRAGMFSSTKPFDADEQAVVEAWLDEVYADFTTKAADDRQMAVHDLEPVARGRVWTGSDAQQRGLVDVLGGLEGAVVQACDRAGLERDRVQVRSVPHVPALARILPAESSESHADSVEASVSLWGASLAPVPTGTPAGSAPRVLSEMLGGLGLPPDGVLGLPWRLRLV